MKTSSEIKIESIEQNSELLRLYLFRVEKFIDDQIKNLESTLKKHENDEWAHASLFEAMTKNINPPDESIQADIELKSIELFPFLLRESFFVMTYGFLEAFLIKECEEKEGKKLRKGDKMDWAKSHLINVGSPYLFESEEWKKIKKYQKLRNCFVHDNGVLEANDNILHEFINQVETLTLINGQIVIKKGFCEEVTTIVEKFLTDLISLGYK